MVKYEVQTQFYSGWENCWTDSEGNPAVFDSRDEAQRAINHHMEASHLAFKNGDLCSPDNIADFRIVKLD